eukprot:TRINITY_DN1330_c0_g1_i2.p2 TRINITY_DN1330_c0_g1~~TRINITY_DN1330_c0_g1_i2.p2  ORF type:complete len:160 (-),score=51.08 TRINITY_DN1330_c0_g1_i2:1312-1791(-)
MSTDSPASPPTATQPKQPPAATPGVTPSQTAAAAATTPATTNNDNMKIGIGAAVAVGACVGYVVYSQMGKKKPATAGATTEVKPKAQEVQIEVRDSGYQTMISQAGPEGLGVSRPMPVEDPEEPQMESGDTLHKPKKSVIKKKQEIKQSLLSESGASED